MMETTLSLNTWKRFVHEGVLEDCRMNKEIAKSWYRCKESQVNPHLEKGEHILTTDEIRFRKEKNSFLIDIAWPHLDKMKQFLIDAGMMALLIDPEGYVLSIIGSKKTLENSRKINFIEGACWTEGNVGTNAIGTALQTKQPIKVTGVEHYAIASHEWSCAAAPIRTDDGKLMGVIDISCPVEQAHPYMLGMVTAIANTIEREISIQMHQDEMELIHHSMDLIERDQPLLICNHKQEVMGASKPIRKHIKQWADMKKTDIFEYGFQIQLEAPVHSKDESRVIGSCVYLSNVDTTNKINHFFFTNPFRFKGEAGTSASFRQTLEDVKKVAPTNANTYILGETGTGKEVIAQAIHENSQRKAGPFIALNCGAIPKELMESELFGYVEGAFTGARRQGYKGKFEQANGGTLFLDEIGEIPHSMQVALLRVLQTRKVTPIGSTQEIPVDVRIITATHRDISQLVKEGKIREDLFYRLYVYPICVPPLRKRKEDIPHLVRYFCKKNDWNMTFPSAFIDKLMQYDWPGNIRELFNVLERLHILSQGGMTEENQWTDCLESMGITKKNEPSGAKENATLSLREKVQKDEMVKALKETQGNVTMAAKRLGIPRSTFYHRLRKFHL